MKLNPIRMNPFDREPRALKRQVRSAVHRVLKSGYYILGPEVEAFESEWSSYTGIPHTVGLGNGHDALELGMRALGIGPGDEVITTAMTAFATVLAIHRTGAKPVIADIDSDTALLSMESVQERVTEKTKAVIFVHLYGRAGNMIEWTSFALKNGLFLIEDCAQAHGAQFEGKHVGSFGVFGAFSFYPTKNLGGVGDGGALVTSEPALAEKVRILRNYGQQNRYDHVVWGANSRLDEIQAAILRTRLPWLDKMTQNRRRNACRLDSLLEHNSLIERMASVPQPENHVHHLYVVRTPARETIINNLRANAIDSLIHYPIPSHFQKPLEAAGGALNRLPISEKHANECLSLPISPWTSDSEIARIVRALGGEKSLASRFLA